MPAPPFIYLFLALLSPNLGQCFPSDSLQFIGHWQNERGSTLVILSEEEGLIAGYYFTGVGKPDPSESFPMTGFVSGDQIVFSVNFGQYGSMTSWAGQHTMQDGQEKLITLWHLTQEIPDEREAEDLWRGILAGASTFTRTQ